MTTGDQDDSTNSGPATGLVYDETYLRHLTSAGHPECPERLLAIMDHLRSEGLLQKLDRVEPVVARMEWIEAVHTKSYIDLARREIEAGRACLSTGDTCVCPETFAVALRAAGGCVAAVDAVLDGRVRNAFCAVRPPGHHASPRAGMGFCVFNNAAVAARYAQRVRGVGKVLIADWDIHHGNGTQDVFYDDGSVFYCSTHLYHNYPMPLTGRGFEEETGEGDGEGTNLNMPMPRGSGDAEIVGAFRERLVPAMETFGPELMIVSTGFDSRIGDPLGGLELTDAGFAELTRLLMSLANGRLVSVLEGGYSLEGLARGAAMHVRTLMQGA